MPESTEGVAEGATTLKVNYGPDTTGEKEAINVPQGTRFDQYTHSDTGGRYFAEEHGAALGNLVTDSGA